MAADGEPFSWRQVEYELAVKYLENLAIEKICGYFKWFVEKSSLDFR